MAKWPNHFIYGKQFQKRPNGNPELEKLNLATWLLFKQVFLMSRNPLKKAPFKVINSDPKTIFLEQAWNFEVIIFIFKLFGKKHQFCKSIVESFLFLLSIFSDINKLLVTSYIPNFSLGMSCIRTLYSKTQFNSTQ